MGALGAEWVIKDDGGFVDNRKGGGDVIDNDTLAREAFKIPQDQADTSSPMQSIPDNTIRFEDSEGNVTSVPADRFYLPNGEGNSAMDESLFQGALTDAKGSKNAKGSPNNWEAPGTPKDKSYGKAGQLVKLIFPTDSFGGQPVIGGIPAPVTPKSTQFNGFNPSPNLFQFNVAWRDGNGREVNEAGIYYPSPDGSIIGSVLDENNQPVPPNGRVPNFDLSLSTGSSGAFNSGGMPGYPDTDAGGLPGDIAGTALADGVTDTGEPYKELSDPDTGDTVQSAPGTGQVAVRDAGNGTTTFVSTGLTKNQGTSTGTGSGGGGKDCPDVDLTPVLEAIAKLEQLEERVYSVLGGNAWTQ